MTALIITTGTSCRVILMDDLAACVALAVQYLPIAQVWCVWAG